MVKLIPVLLIVLSGCSFLNKTTYVQGYYPVIPVPERPQLPKLTRAQIAEPNQETAEKLEQAVIDLKTYARKLEIGISEYNTYAKGKNEQTDKLFNPED